jgi:hypothetical protein
VKPCLGQPRAGRERADLRALPNNFGNGNLNISFGGLLVDLTSRYSGRVISFGWLLVDLTSRNSNRVGAGTSHRRNGAGTLTALAGR